MATKFRFKNADGTTVDFDDYYVRSDYFRSGNLWVWGIYAPNGLGVQCSSPVQTAAFGSNWKTVSCGGSTGGAMGAAIKTDGTLWCWGYNLQGQVGDNTITSRASPVQTVAFATNWLSCASGGSHNAAIKTDGTLWCWGYNANGQLGDNTITNRSSPVQTITLGNNWKQVCCGINSTFAIKTDGSLWCWGNNGNGELADNTTASKSSPVQTVAFGTNWKQVSAGQLQTAAVKTDGTLWTWGFNSNGQLGDNTTTSRSSPVQTITYATNWKEVDGGGYDHMVAIKTDGTLWGWGNNNYGQLGDNTTTKRSSPVQTVSFGNNWKSVGAGQPHSYAIKTDGTLWGWGFNGDGELGDNTTTRRSSPVQTIALGTNWKFAGSGPANCFTAAIQYQDDYQ